MNKESLKKELELREITCTQEQLDALISLMNSTLETNKKFNLTAIKDEETFLEKMIFDSALALHNIDINDKKIIDVGTGAGFPGLVLYILNPKTDLTLLDSSKKKIDYLQYYANSNNYQINCVYERAEEYANKNREAFDYAIARAVSSLNILLELILPLLKVGGTFIAMKSKDAFNEIENAKGAFKKLGCHLESVYEDALPESGEVRYLLYIKKDKTTNTKYPRDYATIKNKPLS